MYHREDGQWALEKDLKFVYDGWNVIVEMNGSTLEKSYLWGLDMSGSMQGAGGVGGLLVIHEHSAGKRYLPTYDGNGNVMALVESQSGEVSGRYEYGAFGEYIRESGPAAKSNAFRFSTKYTDTETGHLYYGYRFYNPQTGRWISRDPIEEEGGINLYGFVGNDGVNRVDLLGLSLIPVLDGGPIHNVAGPDVTDFLRSILGNIELTFNHKWTFEEKCRACKAAGTYGALPPQMTRPTACKIRDRLLEVD